MPPRVKPQPMTPAQWELAEKNRRLVHWAVRRWTYAYDLHPTPDELDALRERCWDGLCRAVQLYDPSRGVRFSAYASWWLRQGVQRWMEERFGLRKKNPPAPVLSLDWEADEDTTSTADASPLEPADHREPTAERTTHVLDLLGQCRRHLDRRSWDVLVMRYQEGMRLEDVGLVLGVTRERVRQIEKKALERLRECMALDVNEAVGG